MLHHEPKHRYKDLRDYVRRCRELRAKLAKAQNPEEITAIQAELEEVRRAFLLKGQTETAVKIDG